MSALAWTPVVGLEVHVQLKTRTKLFCGCEVAFGGQANARICPVCTGQPGALPVVNAEALDLAVRAALALGGSVSPRSRFARKHYFYFDLPKGYQISQFDRPLSIGGGIRLASGKLARLVRVHVEEDAGKAIHDAGDATLIDLNRAGVPLVECVGEPDLAGSEEAHEYLGALREILQYAGVSDCDMEKGSLRCDVNVSVRRGEEPLRTKVEIKNLNSLRHVRDAIDHELARQTAAYDSGDPARFPVQETRLYDPDRGETRTMRRKETSADYRYFSDPDLPPIVVDEARLERQRGFLPEMPAARRERYERELALSAYDAAVLTASRDVADFFEATVRAGATAKDAANWIANDVLGALAEGGGRAAGLGGTALHPRQLAELCAMLAEGEIGRGAAREVLGELMRAGGDPREIARDRGMRQVRDEEAIAAWCREALAARPGVADEVRSGNAKALGALIGPVMQASGGRADPRLVRSTLVKLIENG